MTLRRAALAGFTLALWLGAWPAWPAANATDTIPSSLSDEQFWKLTQDLSESDGYFRSENLLSNEMVFARVVPELLGRTKPDGIYLGVGPEQNFTYIATMRPRMAFIIDIRRGNLLLQLMYKALFELSPDRAEFVSRLFTKARPTSLTPESTAKELMDAYWDVVTSDEPTYQANLRAIEDVLIRKHRFPLSAQDRDGLAYVYHAFYWFGPRINWSSSANGSFGGGQTYADLMMQADATGRGLSYLATEASFQAVKALHAKNLVVPVIGNFGGTKAIRAVGRYLKERGAVVTAFYLSNVEQYLRQDGLWPRFCENVATLPLDDASVFIRPGGLGMRGVTSITLVNGVPTSRPATITPGGSALSPMMTETAACGAPK
jgi:hypothetical protein